MARPKPPAPSRADRVTGQARRGRASPPRKAAEAAEVEQPAKPPASDLDTRVAEATAVHLELMAVDDRSFAHRRRVALAASAVWSLEAHRLRVAGDHDAARKAASTANESEKLAAQLEKDSAHDRLAELEGLVKAARQGAATMRAHLPVRGPIE